MSSIPINPPIQPPSSLNGSVLARVREFGLDMDLLCAGPYNIDLDEIGSWDNRNPEWSFGRHIAWVAGQHGLEVTAAYAEPYAVDGIEAIGYDPCPILVLRDKASSLWVATVVMLCDCAVVCPVADLYETSMGVIGS